MACRDIPLQDGHGTGWRDMALLRDLVRELRDTIKTRTDSDPRLLALFRAEELPRIHELDAQIAAECTRREIRFPDVDVQTPTDCAEFGFTKFAYSPVKLGNSYGWYLMPTANWWQCLLILETMDNQDADETDRIHQVSQPREKWNRDFLQWLKGRHEDVFKIEASIQSEAREFLKTHRYPRKKSAYLLRSLAAAFRHWREKNAPS